MVKKMSFILQKFGSGEIRYSEENRSLSLSFNKADNVSELIEPLNLYLATLSNIEVLSINWPFQTFPKNLFRFSSVEYLSIFDTPFFPKNITVFPSVKHLSLTGDISEYLGPFPELETLYLTRTKIFPRRLQFSSKLSLLDLSQFKGKTLPSFICHFHHLHKIVCHHCDFKNFPSTIKSEPLCSLYFHICSHVNTLSDLDKKISENFLVTIFPSSLNIEYSVTNFSSYQLKYPPEQILKLCTSHNCCSDSGRKLIDGIAGFVESNYSTESFDFSESFKHSFISKFNM